MIDSTRFVYLPAAGVLPFVACAVLPLLGIREVPPFGELHLLISSYGLAIVSFLAGTHWAMQLAAPEKTPFDLLIASNAVFLAAWIAYVLADPPRALLTHAIALVALLVIDYRLYAAQLTNRRYWRTRSAATLVAATSLLLSVVTS